VLAGARLPVFPEAAVTATEAGIGGISGPPIRHIVIAGSFAEPVQGNPQPIHLWSWTGSAWLRVG
jgi:hypothetical protein